MNMNPLTIEFQELQACLILHCWYKLRANVDFKFKSTAELVADYFTVLFLLQCPDFQHIECSEVYQLVGILFIYISIGMVIT